MDRVVKTWNTMRFQATYRRLLEIGHIQQIRIIESVQFQVIPSKRDLHGLSCTGKTCPTLFTSFRLLEKHITTSMLLSPTFGNVCYDSIIYRH